MNKLERYLDQICRSIGGPKSLRQHVRQELREHLLDAAAEHKAAGMPEEAALDRAILDFGGPEEVRSELEEAHGYRMLPVVIEKAMQWKERTMRARWLWTTWAHLTLAGVIALEVFGLIFAGLYLVPRFQMNMRIGVIDPVILETIGFTWMATFLSVFYRIVEHYLTWVLLLTALILGIFEWRVRSENKTFIRLSAWGTAAAALTVLALLTAFSLVGPYMVASPAMGRIARPFAMQQLASIDTSISAMEKGLANKNWDAIMAQASLASQAVDRLMSAAPAIHSLFPQNRTHIVESQRAKLKAANGYLSDAQRAAQQKDATSVEAALRQFRELYEPFATAAAKPPD
jgi:hypothetical protein